MNLKEIREAFILRQKLNFNGLLIFVTGLKYVIDRVTDKEVLKIEVKSEGGNTYVFDRLDIFRDVTPWEEPTNKGEIMQTKQQKTLELIKAALAGETILWIDGEVTSYKGLDLVSMIMENPSSYSIKPKTKTVEYQTRLYETVCGVIQTWSSLNNGDISTLSTFKRWLEPTQQHVCEYEVK